LHVINDLLNYFAVYNPIVIPPKFNVIRNVSFEIAIAKYFNY